MTYAEKLKDPRWQKKRLEILNRDEFTCQKCYDTESTLHVHHRYYEKGKEPWEANESALITLCESCHESETSEFAEYAPLLIEALKIAGFWADDLRELACGFALMTMAHIPDVVAAAISAALRTDTVVRQLIANHLNGIGILNACYRADQLARLSSRYKSQQYKGWLLFVDEWISRDVPQFDDAKLNHLLDLIGTISNPSNIYTTKLHQTICAELARRKEIENATTQPE